MSIELILFTIFFGILCSPFVIGSLIAVLCMIAEFIKYLKGE